MTGTILVFYKLLFNREEAADLLGIGVRSVDHLVARGLLKPRRIGNAVRFYVVELIRFASQNETEFASDENTGEVTDDHA
jgi:phage terminase Nu1 subunit (DNA packaging protein)